MGTDVGGVWRCWSDSAFADCGSRTSACADTKPHTYTDAGTDSVVQHG